MSVPSSKPSAAWGEHLGDGTDARGDHLPITIRIGPDGRVYFHDITHGLVPVALALCPEDGVLRARQRLVERFEGGTP